jgi:hypothetical protein
MSTLKMQRYSKDAIRLMRGPHIVGMLLRRTDNRWSICDREEKPLTKRTFLQANMARDYAETEGLIQ